MYESYAAPTLASPDYTQQGYTQQTAVVHYTIYLPNGQAISSHETGSAYRLPLRRGQAIPGLEEAVHNMEIGETRRIQLTPAQAFGEHDAQRVRFAEHKHLSAPTELHSGQPVRLSTKGNVEQAFVRDRQDEGVVFDLNHPLAGLELTMDVTLLAIE